MPKIDIELIKTILELFIMIIIAVASIVLLFKILIKKIDKNDNGKIEANEITDADMQFLKQMLKESIETIAGGMLTLNGITGKKAYNLLLNEMKANKVIFENIEKEKANNEKNEKNN